MSLCESVYNPALHPWGNNMLSYGQNVAAEPSCVSPVSAAVMFLPPSMEPICHYRVFPSPCYLAAFVMSLEMLSQAKRKGNLLFFSASCICVITWCIAVSFDFPGL
jgi:hypothetical protein